MKMKTKGMNSLSGTERNKPRRVTKQIQKPFAAIFGVATLLMGPPPINALTTVRRPESRAYRLMEGIIRVPSWTSKASMVSVSTRLQYSDGIDDESSIAYTGQVSKIGVKAWWSNVFRGTPDAASQQVVDEYLEFLDRRYHRLHDEEEMEDSKQPFSVLKWLRESPSEDFSQDQRDNALYALGIAKSASQKLLQKKSRTKERASRKKRDVIKAKVTPKPSDLTVRSMSLMKQRLLGTRATTLKHLKPLKKPLIVLSKAISKGPINSAIALWNLAGGKDTLALGVSVLTVLFFVLRPLLSKFNQNSV